MNKWKVWEVWAMQKIRNSRINPSEKSFFGDLFDYLPEAQSQQ